MSRIAQVLFLFALSLLGPAHAAAQMAGHNMAAHNPQPPQADEPLIVGDQVTSIPYFTLRDGLSSQLTLFNSAPDPTPVAITLYNPEGRPYSPPPVTLDGHSFKVLQLKDVVPNADFDSGRIEVAFRGISMTAVTVQASIYSLEKRVLVESRHLHMFMSSKLSGIVWLPDDQADGFLSITNSGNSRRTVQWTVGAKKSEIVLFGHQSRLVKLNEGMDRRAPSPQLISLHHDGLPGDIIAGGFVLDLKKGYSATIPMVDPAVMRSSRLAGAHVRLGETDGREGFPKNTRFFAPLLLANTGDKPANVTVSLDYSVSGPKQEQSSKKLAPDKVSIVAVKRVTIRPGAVERIELSRELTGLPAPAEIKATGIDIVYDTPPGTIIGQLTNVDESGDYSFEVPIKDPSAMDMTMSGGYPWTIENGKHTTVYIKNTTDKTVRAYPVLAFPDGTMYNPPLIELQPFQTLAIDLQKLKDSKQADVQGQVFPGEATHGQFVWRQQTPYSVIGRAETVSPKDGIGSSFTCGIGCCTNFTQFHGFNPTSSAGAVGTSIPLSTEAHGFDCNHYWYANPSNDYALDWSTDNSNIAYPDGYANAVLVGAGSTYINAQFDNDDYFWDYDDQACYLDSVTQWTGGIVKAAVPVNYHQTAAYDAGNGTLHFEYAWESSSGDLGDLDGCLVGEHVTYPGQGNYQPPSPPFAANAPFENPFIASAAATLGVAQDNHSTNNNFVTPYTAASFTGTQYYRYICPNQSQWTILVGPNSIVRSVAQNPNSSWNFTITKSGSSATINPLP